MAEVQYGSVRKVAQLIGTSPATVWRWTADPAVGFPQPIRLSPQTTRWSIDEVVAWVESRRRGEAEAAG